DRQPGQGCGGAGDPGVEHPLRFARADGVEGDRGLSMTTASATALGSELPTYTRWPLSIARGRGSTVWDDSVKAYLDLYGGHAVASTGHSHPEVVRAIAE